MTVNVEDSRAGLRLLDDVRREMDEHVDGLIWVPRSTSGAKEAPPSDIDRSKRMAGGHAYYVKGFDEQGRIVLGNPWGPAGGFSDKGFCPGEIHLTEEEFNKWFNSDSTRFTP